MSDIARYIQDILDKVEGFLSKIKLPSYLRDLFPELKADLKEASEELYGSGNPTMGLHLFKRKLRTLWGASVRDAWDEAPTIILLFDFLPVPKEIVKAFVMPPILRNFRAMMKKLPLPPG